MIWRATCGASARTRRRRARRRTGAGSSPFAPAGRVPRRHGCVGGTPRRNRCAGAGHAQAVRVLGRVGRRTRRGVPLRPPSPSPRRHDCPQRRGGRSAACVDLEGRSADRLREGRVRVGGGQGDQDLDRAGWPTARTSSRREGTVGWTAVSRCRTSSGASPWSATAAAVSTHSHVASSRVSTSCASSGSTPSCSASHSRAYGRSAGSSSTARTSGSAGAPTTRNASKARPRRRASSPRAAAISSVTALPTGRAASQARYSARAAAGRSRAQPRSMSSAPCSMFPAGLCAATQICSSLTHTAQLPSGVRVACPSP